MSSRIGRRVRLRGNVELVADAGAEELSGTEDEIGAEDARRPGWGNLFCVGPPGQVGLIDDDVEKVEGLGWKKLMRRSELHHRKVCVIVCFCT